MQKYKKVTYLKIRTVKIAMCRSSDLQCCKIASHLFRYVVQVYIFLRPLDKKECSMGVCKNGATCHEMEGDYSCACESGYAGKNCDQGKPNILFPHFN